MSLSQGEEYLMVKFLGSTKLAFHLMESVGDVSDASRMARLVRCLGVLSL